jgi:predicted nucleic acid-binding protein
MTRVVVDASVIVKWFFRQREADVDRARALLRRVQEGELEVVQPPHWLAEVCAVSVRLHPPTARAAAPLLTALEFPVCDHPNLYCKAVELAAELNHHLFDTLYHAAALLEPAATLVTADERYLRKAAPLGHIASLAETSLDGSSCRNRL